MMMVKMLVVALEKRKKNTAILAHISYKLPWQPSPLLVTKNMTIKFILPSLCEIVYSVSFSWPLYPLQGQEEDALVPAAYGRRQGTKYAAPAHPGPHVSISGFGTLHKGT